VQTQKQQGCAGKRPKPGWAGKEAPLEGLKEIALEMNEILLGSDAEQAQITLPYPGISPLHARLSKSERGSVTIADMAPKRVRGSITLRFPKRASCCTTATCVQIGKLTFRYKIGSIKQV
jgi:hypothetical protein